MSTALEIARNQILTPSGMGEHDLQNVLDAMLGHAIDYADLYFESTCTEAWVLEDGIVKEGSHHIDQGVGIRAVNGEKTGLAYSDEILPTALMEAAHAARAIATRGGQSQLQVWHRQEPLRLYTSLDPLSSMGEANKVQLLLEIDKAARGMDPRIGQVVVNLTGRYSILLIAASDGTLSADVRPLVRLNVSVVAEHGGRRESGTAGGGGRFGYNWFIEEERALGFAQEAVRQALINLESIPAPAGTLTVVLGPGWPGILLHEAIGHGLEGDFNRKGTSAFTGRIGRRESYAHRPMPRMTNTYMLAGSYPPEEIIASVDRGLYAVSFGGGQVDIVNGKFVFSASEAYLIENGKVTRPVKGATLIGNGPEVLTRISMVGNDLKLDTGVGTCGKEGQSVPVGVGQPTLRIDGLTVGGTTL